MVLRSHENIKKHGGAEFGYLIASGKFSQAVFSKVGFEVLKEIKYADFMDKNGKQIIWDNREHPTCQLMCMKLDWKIDNDVVFFFFVKIERIWKNVALKKC